MTAQPDFISIRDDIISLTRRVGAYILSGLDHTITVDTKTSSFDAVTEYDRQAEKMLGEHLRTHYPEFGIVGEEGSRYQPDADYVWYIDPIDGTNNFSHHVPFFSVSVGLWWHGEDGEDRPVLGVIFDPCRDELFHAIAGQGAFSRIRGQDRQLKISSTATLDKAIIGTGFPYVRTTESARTHLAEFAAFHPHAQGLRRLGAASLDIAYVAAGRFDIYWEYGLHSWDVAASILFLLEAGGAITTVDGSPFQLKEDVDLACSNGLLQETVLNILKSVPQNQ